MTEATISQYVGKESLLSDAVSGIIMWKLIHLIIGIFNSSTGIGFIVGPLLGNSGYQYLGF